MFGLHPVNPTRPEDYVVHRAGRSLRNSRVKPRGLTPRRLTQPGPDSRRSRAAQSVLPRPWVDEPAILLSDVIAGPRPWTGALLDPAAPQPVPVGALIRSAAAGEHARHWLVWPDGRLRPPAALVRTDPQSVAAYIDEPAMAHFGRELDNDRIAGIVIEDGLEEPERIDPTGAVAEAVTLWIAGLLQRDARRTRTIAAAPAPRNHERRPPVCRWL